MRMETRTTAPWWLSLSAALLPLPLAQAQTPVFELGFSGDCLDRFGVVGTAFRDELLCTLSTRANPIP
jgi:hypothetical protein